MSSITVSNAETTASKRTMKRSPSDETTTKRRKVTRACDHCKQRKRRCTGELPCSICQAYGIQCTYFASYTRGRAAPPQNNEPVEAKSPYIAQYQGPTSAHSFLRRAWEKFGKPKTSEDLSSDESGTIFEYGDRPSSKVEPSTIHFPSPPNVERMLTHYFERAAPTYRFLHEPTVRKWTQQYQSETTTSTLSKPRQTIVIMVIAVAGLLLLGEPASDSPKWYELEMLYRAAQQKLDSAQGRPSVEHIQARLCIIQYLMSTSRPNQAWYMIGTTAQLVFALGLHRDTGVEQNYIISECQKRAFWVSYIIDMYLSNLLGRPFLIRDEDVDQQYPALVDDEKLTDTNCTPVRDKDCAMMAVVKHIELCQIVKRVIKSQSLVSNDISYDYESGIRFNADIMDWQSRLPISLSGIVPSSSLIPLYRRQYVATRRAHCHAVIFTNRPCLISDLDHPERANMIDLCLSAAKKVLDLNQEFHSEGRLFSTFWNTHYVTFNALAVIYVWIMQRRIGRVPDSREVPDIQVLFDQAEKGRKHLQELTSCAPTLRNERVLDELQQEARRTLHTEAIYNVTTEQQVTIEADDVLDWLTLTEFPDLWLQLDAFPFSDFDNSSFV